MLFAFVSFDDDGDGAVGGYLGLFFDFLPCFVFEDFDFLLFSVLDNDSYSLLFLFPFLFSFSFPFSLKIGTKL